MLQRIWFALACVAVIAAAFPAMLWLAIMIQFWPLWTAGFAAIGVLTCFVLVVAGAFGLLSALSPEWKAETRDKTPPPAPKRAAHKGGKR
jgi:hypothetical protein